MFSEDFDLFTGAGFAPDETSGLLNSDAWIITGLSDGNLNFGDSATSGDFARGTSTGGVSSGGVYSFEVANGNNILGVQPAGSDFTPGEIILRLQNTGETILTEIAIDYDIFFFNDQSRANSLNFSYSVDNVTYNPVAALDFTTPEAANLSTTWETVDRSTTINGLSLNPDDFFYLKWTGDDVSGSGSRDEYGIDNISVSDLTLPELDPPDVTEELISTIQGDGFQSPLIGETVIVEAVVVGDFQGSDGLSGFFVQEEDADADNNPLTSEGIFIFDGSSPTVDVNIGDLVQVTGTVAEFNDLTELTNVTDVQIISSNNPLPTAATVNFPVSGEIDLESVEGMLTTIPDTLFVTEYFNLDRFGEIRVASDGDSNAPNTDGRLDQYTQFNAPDVDGFTQYQEAIATRQIVLDDGSSVQNPDTLIFGRDGNPLSSTNTLRGGDTVTGVTGVLDERFGDYRLQTSEGVDFQGVNERPATPDEVGGSLKVVAFNVLNFFTTLDDDSGLGSGPNNLSPRGADNQAEFDRQIEKLVTTLNILDADILALTELENEFGGDQNGDGQYAIETLVNALNDSVGAGTYAYVDPGVNYIGGDAIAVGAIYKTATVQVAPGTTVELLTDDILPSLDADLSGEPVFEGVGTSRVPLAVTFEEIATGETFTLAVNHFKSKGSSGLSDTNDPNFDQGDGQGFWNFRRTEASKALDAWLKTDPTGSGDSDYLIAGDINAYAQEDPVTFLENQGYTDLVEQFVGDEAYSFVFDGQYGTLDYALANETLQTQVTGATEWRINSDEPDALDYNLDFGRDPSLFDGSIPYRTSDHDPIVVGLDLESTAEPFTLQILHTSDQEAGIPALEDAIGLSAVMNALEDDYDNTLKLSSGDIFIAGPFFNASRNIYGEPGIADILIQNELGWDAAAVGNHEFDAGPGTFATLIAPDAAIQGVGIDPNTGYEGTAFPYLSTNLDYSTDSSDLKDFVVPDGESPTPNSLAGSVVIEVGGEAIGVVGAVTPILPQIANIGGITMLTDSTVTSVEDQAQTIADNVQPVIDELVAQGINKVVLMTHLQQFEIEQALAEKLTDVDVLMGGGNHRVMANDDDILRQDETQTASQILQPYPQVFQDADNNPIYLINTAANYRYLGQLVLEFDTDGFITNIGDESGTFATDIAGVDRLYDQEITTFEQVKGVADTELVDIVDNVEDFINSQDGNIFGNTEVYLNGRRESVRSEETNLGNLTADANLWYASQYGIDVDISVKNGGGIRDAIGVSFIEGGTNELVELPPQPNPEVGKEEGDVSQLDVSNSLRFDNKLSVVDISAQGIKDLAEHFVARWTPEATPGQFGQIGGFSFSYDPDNTAIVFERNGEGDAIGVEVAGDRIVNLVIDNPDGTQEVIVENGELQVSPDQTYKMVILDFLAGGGDGYPVFHFQNVTLLEGLEAASLPDNAPDLVVAGEQDALGEYLAEFYPTDEQAFDEADTPITEDTRIQNLNFREDTIIDEVIEPTPTMVRGTSGEDFFDTEDPGDSGFMGDNQLLFTGSGDDFVDVSFSAGGDRSRLDLGSGDDIIFAGTNNRIIAGSGDDMLFLGYGEGDNVVTGGSGMDQFWLTNDDVDVPTEANIITDFTIGEDVIGFGATDLSFDDLTLTQNGLDTTINGLGQDLAVLRRVESSELSASDFVFG